MAMKESGACFLSFLSFCLSLLGTSTELKVTVENPFNEVTLFDPVTLECTYQTTANYPPLVTWTYKSFCKHNATECPDWGRTVRIVATKQSNKVTLGEFYQGRKITIDYYADLTIKKTLIEDTGLYYCNIFIPNDLSGSNEAIAQLLVKEPKAKC